MTFYVLISRSKMFAGFVGGHSIEQSTKQTPTIRVNISLRISYYNPKILNKPINKSDK